MGIYPYRPKWIMRLPRKKALGLAMFLFFGVPFIILGGVGAIAWLIGHVLFEPNFYLILGAIWIYLLITK